MIQDQSMTNAASQMRFQGKQALTAGYISAAGQGLSGIGSLGTQYAENVHSGAMKDTFGIYKPKPRNIG